MEGENATITVEFSLLGSQVRGKGGEGGREGRIEEGGGGGGGGGVEGGGREEGREKMVKMYTHLLTHSRPRPPRSPCMCRAVTRDTHWTSPHKSAHVT